MTDICLITCMDPLSPSRPDPANAAEAVLAAELGWKVYLVDHDALEAGDMRRALRWVQPGQDYIGIYRGWMMAAPAYAKLYEDLSERRVRMATSPDQYRACHHLPGSLPFVRQWMAFTTLLPIEEMDSGEAFAQALQPFGVAPVVIKDWVKSEAAGYWDSACFIPSAQDLARAHAVVDRFVELRGSSLTGGIVFRAYTKLARTPREENEEWRCFAVAGRLLGPWPRFAWSGEPQPPAVMLRDIAAVVPSPFATIDVARTALGAWRLLEVGDGQVSEMPASGSRRDLFSAVADRLAG